MKIIGLTGGIGSGKSTVLKMFQKLGAETYIADVEAKKLMNTNKKLKSQIVDLFGAKAYKNGVLNTDYLSNIVFNSTDKLKALNALVHPKVREHFTQFIKKCTTRFVIYEAAILFESGSSDLCDFIITVNANLEDKINRILKRDTISRAQILDRMKNQLNDNFKIKNADFVINNTKLTYTKSQVLTIYNLISKL